MRPKSPGQKPTTTSQEPPVAPASRRGDVIPQSRTDLALLGYALSRGWFMRNLLQAQHIQSFPVQIVHGAGSRLARSADVVCAVASCRLAGIEVHDVQVDGGHALWHSLPDVARMARLTRSQWSWAATPGFTAEWEEKNDI